MTPRRWFPAAAGAAALAVAAVTARGRGQALDRRLYAVANGTGGGAADAFFAGITELGSLWAAAGAAVALSARGRRREAADALGAAVAMWVLGQGIKRLILRPRPYDALRSLRVLIDRPRGASWPSSHPAVLMAFVTVAARDLHLSWPMKVAVACLAGLVGSSRVYLGVHFPADVVGGLLLGRGVADLWTSAVTPRLLGRLPGVVPVTALLGTVEL